VTYLTSWPNFAQRFGLVVDGFVEPKPGIPPSPSHTIALIKEMMDKRVKLILVEPYFDMKTPRSIARETGGRVVEMTPSTGGEKGVDDYIALFDHDLKLLTDAARDAGAK
jgi:zinc/manganese transport system substrate-binding protein